LVKGCLMHTSIRWDISPAWLYLRLPLASNTYYGLALSMNSSSVTIPCISDASAIDFA